MKTMKEYLSTAEGVKQMWEKVNEVLDGFNFNTVASVMEALDWSWHCTKEDAEIYDEAGCKVKWESKYGLEGCEYYPEYPQLLAQARELLVDAIETMPEGEKRWSSATGGFKAEAYINDVTDGDDDFKNAVDLALYFIVEEYETD